MTQVLAARDLTAGYSKIAVLQSLSLSVDSGDLLAIVGPNGAGKTTLAHCLLGLVPVMSGEIELMGQRVSRWPVEKRVRAGMAIVPEGRRLFPRLTVQDNLQLALYELRKQAASSRQERFDMVYDMFPVLRERTQQLAGSLSGGEQEMLAIARALVLRPRVLILDEPSTGLAPAVVQQIFELLVQITQSLSCACVLVEQQARLALSIATRACVLSRGHVRAELTPEQLAAGDLTEDYFDLSSAQTH